MTLRELRERLTSDELTLWMAYHLYEGLPQARTEAAIALSGSAQCQTWGAKVKPRDLVPDFSPPQVLDYKTGASLFSAWASAHNSRPNKPN